MKNENPFNVEVDRLLLIMSELDPSDEEYKRVADSLKTLCEARAKKAAFPVEPEAIVAALANLLGIVLILQHERLHVVTSRAVGFIRK